jgi:O-antigen/teichoic acid export membrane protein
MRVAGRDRPGQIAVGRLAASGLGFLSAPIVARSLGPEGRGITAAILAAFFLLPIFMSVGLPLEVRRLAAVSPAGPVQRSARVTALFVVPIAVGVALVADHLLTGALGAVERRWVVVGLATAPMMISWMCDQSVLIAQERYRAVASMQVSQPLVFVVVLVVWFAFSDLTVAAVLAASVIGTAATFVLGLGLTGVRAGHEKGVGAFRLLRGSLGFAGSSAAEAAASRLALVLVLPLIGPAGAGFYSVAATVSALPITFGHALGASYFNQISRASGNGRERLGVLGVRSGVALGLVLALLLGLMSPILVTVVFGPAFDPALPATLVALVGAPFGVGAFVGSMALAATGRGWRMTAAQVTGLGCGVVGLYLLGPALGAMGAALASVAASVAAYAMVLTSMPGWSLRSALPRPRDLRDGLDRILGNDSGGPTVDTTNAEDDR